MVRFSSNIVVVSIIIVGFTLNYASAAVTNSPDGKKNTECGLTGGFVATGDYKTETGQNGKQYLVAEKAVYGDAGFNVGRGNSIIPLDVANQNESSKNKEPKPEKEVLSRKEFTGKGAFRIGVENTVEMVDGKPVIKQSLFGHIGGQLSISRTLNDCEIELKKHFGENCIIKNKAKLCANRAMVALTLSDLPDGGIPKMYFEILMENIRQNKAMNTEEFCEYRFKKLEDDLKYVLRLVELSDLPQLVNLKFSATEDMSFKTKLYDGVLKKAKDKCIENLQLFRKVDNYDPGYKTKCILKNAFKNIRLINLENTDEIDYFIDNIFKRFHIEAGVPNPEKFCLLHKKNEKSKVPVDTINTSDKQDTTPPAVAELEPNSS